MIAIAVIAGAACGALLAWWGLRRRPAPTPVASAPPAHASAVAPRPSAGSSGPVRDAEAQVRNLRLVLDNLAQGFLMVDVAGTLVGERSAVVERWFGGLAPGATFSGLVSRFDADLAAWFDVGLDSLRGGTLPGELCLAQMPARFAAGLQTFSIRYKLLRSPGQLDRILIILSDITEQVIHERAEREQRELLAMFQRVASDRAGFEDFLEEAAGLVMTFARPGDPMVERRTLHTLKGSCAVYGFERYAALCQDIETELQDTTGGLTDAHRMALAVSWRTRTAQISQLLGSSRRDVLEVELSELARVVDHVRQGAPPRELTAALTAWSHELVGRKFERLASHAIALAHRLGKGDIAISIADDGIRLDAARWAEFWRAMVHAVRNAIDHGIETPEVRARAGKPPQPTLSFSASRAPGRLTLRLSDDGAGMDWEAVRARARAMGLPAETREDLVAAVFTDGMSTREVVTDTSGRGVGLAALRAAVASLGGVVELESAPGQGLTLRCVFPESQAQLLVLRAPTQPIRPISPISPVRH